MEDERLFTVKEAADFLRVSPWTIHSWLASGRMLRSKVGGRTVVRENEVKKMIVDGARSPAPRRRTKERGEKTARKLKLKSKSAEPV